MYDLSFMILYNCFGKPMPLLDAVFNQTDSTIQHTVIQNETIDTSLSCITVFSFKLIDNCDG